MSEKYTILVVDDEAPARRKVINFVNRLSPESTIVEAKNADEARKLIESQKIDLVFLDIHMPGTSGIEVLENLNMYRIPPIIFTTAYDEYAIKAFELNAIDYLLKPFDFERFSSSFEKMIHQSELLDTKSAYQRLLEDIQEPAGKDRIWIQQQGKYRPVAFENIDFLESSGNYVMIHTDQNRYLIRKSLSMMIELLPANSFVQCHRSYIVNLRRIDSVSPKSHGDCNIHLKSGMTIPLSRKYRDHLL